MRRFRHPWQVLLTTLLVTVGLCAEAMHRPHCSHATPQRDAHAAVDSHSCEHHASDADLHRCSTDSPSLEAPTDLVAAFETGHSHASHDDDCAICRFLSETSLAFQFAEPLSLDGVSAELVLILGEQSIPRSDGLYRSRAPPVLV